MKLNLVADYELPNGKRFSCAHTIDGSENLANLNRKTTLSFPCAGNGWLYVAPISIMAQPSRKQAILAADYLNGLAEKQGRRWQGEAIEAKAETEKTR